MYVSGFFGLDKGNIEYFHRRDAIYGVTHLKCYIIEISPSLLRIFFYFLVIFSRDNHQYFFGINNGVIV